MSNGVKIILVLIIFYFLVLFQASFLTHFHIFETIPNLIFISAILINLLEPPRSYFGIFPALAGGFFLDIFSTSIIGKNVLILVGLAIFIKIILIKYVRNPV